MRWAAPDALVRSLVGATFFGVQLLSVAARAQGDARSSEAPSETPAEDHVASQRGDVVDPVTGNVPEQHETVAPEEEEGEQSHERAVDEVAADSRTSNANEPQSTRATSNAPASEKVSATETRPPDAPAPGKALAVEDEAPTQTISPPDPSVDKVEDPAAPRDSRQESDARPAAGAQEAQAPKGAAVGEGARRSPQEPRDRSPYDDPNHPSRFRTGLTVVPRLAFAVSGWTQFDEECTASGRLTCDDEQSFGRRESSGISFGVEGLYQLIPSLRLGVAAGVIPSVRGDGGDVRERFGTEAGLSGIVEGIVDINRSMAVSVRGQVGTSILWTAGRAQEEIDRAVQECDQVRQEGIDCYVEYGPFVAPFYGAGAGFLWPVSKHRLRLDLLYQFSKRTLYRQEAETSDSAAKARATMDISRLWLSLSFEI